MVPFRGFLDQASHPFEYTNFFLVSRNQFSWRAMDGCEFAKPEFMYAIIVRRFPFQYFLNVALSDSRNISTSCPSSLCKSFKVIHLLSLSVEFFLFPYFTPKLFCFLCFWLLVYPRAFSTYLLVEFSFVILKCPVLFVLFGPVSLTFVSPFCRQYFFIYLFKLYCHAGLFIPTYSCIETGSLTPQ